MQDGQQELAGWKVAKRARREAAKVRDLVRDTVHVELSVIAGHAETEHADMVCVPPTWCARVRSIAAYQGRPVVTPEGTEATYLVLDAHPLPRRQLRAGESAWRVVLLCRTDDGTAVVRGVLRRARCAWRLGRSLPDARRRPTAATLPEPAWTIRRLAKSNERGHVDTPDRAMLPDAKYAQWNRDGSQ